MKFTRELLSAKGFRPDGKGALVRITSSHCGHCYCSWGQCVCPGGPTIPAGALPPKPAIRVPRARAPNHTESRYGDILRVRYQEPHVVLYEPLSFHLNSGASYCPDWVVFEGPTIIAAWEVKGPWGHHSHSRSALAWKSCAQEWPMILWGWAKWANLTDGWLETEIVPERRARL